MATFAMLVEYELPDGADFNASRPKPEFPDLECEET